MIGERVNVIDLRFDNNVIVAFSFRKGWFESAVKHHTRAVDNDPENRKHLLLQARAPGPLF